jgi:hypothetical protein
MLNDHFVFLLHPTPSTLCCVRNVILGGTPEGLMSEIIKIKAASPVVIEITNRNNFFIPSSF